jgi:hypothetical protein
VSKFPDDLEGSPEPFVPLDSVGGCTTLVRADVHREGALFAPYYLIGASWKGDGYDGVESEGARAFARVRAFLLCAAMQQTDHANPHSHQPRPAVRPASLCRSLLGVN